MSSPETGNAASTETTTASTILLVEDSILVRRQVKDLLCGQGYNVIETDNGKAGLEVARKQHLDLIILDINMPLMNGLELLTELRKLEHHRQTPAFVLTTESSPSLLAQARASGAIAWIIKPFEQRALVQGVQRALERTRRART